MNKILQGILVGLVCYFVAFCASSSIIGSWILFWDYGWLWNETTVPPLVVLDIFLSNIGAILILSGILTPIVIILLLLFNNSR